MSKIGNKILHIIEWIFAILALILSITMLFSSSKSLISGIILLISAFLISPIFEKVPILNNNPKKKTLVQLGSAFILFFIGICLVPSAPPKAPLAECSLLDVQTSNTTCTTLSTTTTITTILPTNTTTSAVTSKATTTFSSTTITTISTAKNTTQISSTTIPEITTTVTTSQNSKEMALKYATECIKNDAYSYNWLLDILDLEGYSHEDVIYALDNCGADWNEEAVERTEILLSIGDLSQEDLTGLLIDEGFTAEQAEYAVSRFNLKSKNEVNTPNIQPPVEIQPESTVLHFVVNCESNCVHIDSHCSAAQKILPENYSEIDIPAEELGNYSETYWACGKYSKRYQDILPKP